ncbi:MAG: alpha/beta fold hydrolase [Alphaproteobacteria bacterium]|nr:alpha/beta fold hydrolase [Alphaproteobacteria bacterium]
MVMLHQSPLSSADLVATMEPLATDFTCLAFDTAGYGHSDPLPHNHPTIADYARSVADALSALGVHRFGLFGNHTGSCIAAELAHLFPERVAGFVADGYVSFTPEEERDLVTNYTPSVAPRWDGAHLAWIWARMRNEYAFFPWHCAGLSLRVDVDQPTPQLLHERLLDWLRAGTACAVGYRAAFAFRGDQAIHQVRCPTLLVTMQPDPLVAHLERLTELPPGVVVERTGWDRRELVERSRAFLRAALGGLPAPPDAGEADETATLSRRFLGRTQQLYAHASVARGRPIVFVHEAGASLAQGLALARALAPSRPVLAFDRPGHGESSGPSGMDIVEEADLIVRQLVGTDWESPDVVALGSGAGLALAVAARSKAARVVAIDPPRPASIAAREAEALVAALQPDWYGGYLLQAWHMARDMVLFEPWHDRSRSGIRWEEPAVLPEAVHRHAVDLLKSLGAPATRAAELAYLATAAPGYRALGVIERASASAFGLARLNPVRLTAGPVVEEQAPALLEFFSP